MNIRPQLEDSLLFITRQVSELTRNQEHTLESALAILEAEDSIAHNPEMLSAIVTLREINSGNAVEQAASSKNMPSIFVVLSGIVQQAKVLPQSLGQLISKFTTLSQKIDDDVDLYLLGLRDSIVYSIVLICMALITSSLAIFKVLPSMSEVYAGFGSNLPAFTIFMLDNGIVICVIVLLILLLYMILLFLGLLSLSRHAQRFQLASTKTPWGFFLKPVINIVNRYVVLAYLSLFKQAGLSDAEVIEKTKKVIDDRNGKNGFERSLGKSLHEKVMTCAMIKTINREVDYQLELTTSTMIKDLSRFRKTLNVGVKIPLFLAIAGIMISFYLPIFMMGSII